MADPQWKDEPEEHDYPAAQSYLGLVLPAGRAARVVRRLRGVPTTRFKAKDLLRAARLPLLPPEDVHVAKDLAKVRAGERLSPVLLVRGDLERGTPLTIADGYHRVCASHHLDADADVSCRIVGQL